MEEAIAASIVIYQIHTINRFSVIYGNFVLKFHMEIVTVVRKSVTDNVVFVVIDSYMVINLIVFFDPFVESMI